MYVPQSPSPHDLPPDGASAQAPKDRDTRETIAALTDWCDSEEENRWPVRL
jgi:hypothetical protein